MTAYKLLGINDEVTTCECCGKAGLKLTVVLADGEREVRYGRDCAARALRPRHGNLTAMRVERMAEQAERDRERAARDAEYFRIKALRMANPWAPVAELMAR